MAEQLTTPDFDVYPTNHRINSVDLDLYGVRLVWDDGVVGRYHALWLRENSPQAETTHPVTRETTEKIIDLPADLSVVDVTIDPDGDLVVQWSHGLTGSRIHRGWLRCHTAGVEDANRFSSPAPVLWDASMQDTLPRFSGNGKPNDEVFGCWLEAVAIYGLAILEGLPALPDTVEILARRVGTVRTSNFGQFFDVQTRPNADSNAYTALNLPAHTDLATREYAPGLQMLFAIENSATGGESLLTDGFAVARHLKDNDPETYAALTSTIVEFKNIAVDTDYRWQSPLIVTDNNGDVVEVRWTDWLRAPMRQEPEVVDTFYKALRIADSLMNDKAFQIEVKLKPGELLCFDNRRILHGRNAFDPASGSRWLRGCYIEREELLSCLRILDRQRRRRGI